MFKERKVKPDEQNISMLILLLFALHVIESSDNNNLKTNNDIQADLISNDISSCNIGLGLSELKWLVGLF